MASKKRRPSFDIPDAVRQAGQAGWVYRTEPAKAGGGRTRRRPTSSGARGSKRAVTPGGDVGVATSPPAQAPPPETPASGWTGRLVGFGLQIAAVPFMVPLYLTAAVSHRLGGTRDE